MKLRAARRVKAIDETEMVSMADIAFLLIIFFMLTTQFMRDTVQIEVPELPEHDRTESGLSVALDRQGTVWFDGTQLDTPAELESLLRERLAGRVQREEREVRFRCEASLPQASYGPVLEAISAAGGVVSIIIDREVAP